MAAPAAAETAAAPGPTATEPASAALLPGATLPPPSAVAVRAETPEKPRPARLLLTTEPAGASVRLGARTICTSPCDVNLEPTAERQALLVRRWGYADEVVDVDLTAGATVSREVALRRLKPAATAPAKPATGSEKKPAPSAPALPALRLDGH
ncbi:MAG: PEGA domain-containing protein [Deltaproteobacteria bacterium]|nr:PEGA domain-containing protein [Deltaproteobacteria bacterium]